jgi:hypothetical protein
VFIVFVVFIGASLLLIWNRPYSRTVGYGHSSPYSSHNHPHHHHHHPHTTTHVDDSANDDSTDDDSDTSSSSDVRKRSLFVDNNRNVDDDISATLSTLVFGSTDADNGDPPTPMHWSRVRGLHGVLYGRNDDSHVLLSLTFGPNAVESLIDDWNLDDIDHSELGAVQFNVTNLNAYSSLCFDTVVPDLAWETALPFYVHTNNLAAGCMDEAYVRCVFTQALASVQSYLGWLPIGHMYTVSQGTAEIARNGRNDVLFGAIPLPNATHILAITSFWWNAGRELIEWDQAYNTVGYQFGPVEQWSYLYLVDLQNTVTHELIHVLGLRDTYDQACTESSCYGFATFRERKKRSLEIDDQVGLTSVYGGVPVVQGSTSTCAVQTSGLIDFCRVRFAANIANTQPPASTTAPIPIVSNAAAIVQPTHASKPRASNATRINVPFVSSNWAALFAALVAAILLFN